MSRELRQFSRRPYPSAPGPIHVLGAATLAIAMTAMFSILPGVDGAGATAVVSVGTITNVSAACPGTNTEVEQAVDPQTGFVYEAWYGCRGIGYARSTDGGASFSAAVLLPGSLIAVGDPVVAVAPQGTVYVAFMVTENGQNLPVVDASFDHGATFPQTTALTPPDPANWGDSPNIAVGPDGTVYVTWDYGPRFSAVVYHCNPVGSCSFSKGDLNVVIQKSTDDAKTFGAMVPVSPGYPWSGADNGPIVVDPSGKVDVVFQDYPTNATTHVLSPATNYFTSSDDGGATWSSAVAIGSTVGTMALAEWWNEPSLAIDAGGNLYTTWDTQKKADTGWLSYSSDGGATWSTPVRAPLDQKAVPHIMQVTGGASGEAFVAWLSDSNPSGYALYVRPFSITGGWLTVPVQISTAFGSRTVWPGDTFGLSTLDATHVMTSWASAVPTGGGVAGVYAAEVTVG